MWHLRSWQHASWTYTCSKILEEGAQPLQHDLCQHWLISGRYVRSRYCPCSTIVFILSQRHWIPCALMHWFSHVGNSPDNHTGMWVVQPDDNETSTSIIHLDTIVWASHLLPVFGQGRGLRTLSCTDTLNTFTRFYVNKYIHWSPCIQDCFLMYFDTLISVTMIIDVLNILTSLKL